jgi:hypothetical protein
MDTDGVVTMNDDSPATTVPQTTSTTMVASVR